MTLKRQLAVERRRVTCLRRRVRILTRERSPARNTVVRWAVRWARVKTSWNALQLRLAVARLEKL